MDRVAGRGFALIYGASILGGAVAYALLAQTPQPMVGASGALFGLAGALVGWNLIDSFDLKESLWPFARIAAFLIAINIVMWWALSEAEVSGEDRAKIEEIASPPGILRNRTFAASKRPDVSPA